MKWFWSRSTFFKKEERGKGRGKERGKGRGNERGKERGNERGKERGKEREGGKGRREEEGRGGTYVCFFALRSSIFLADYISCSSCACLSDSSLSLGHFSGQFREAQGDDHHKVRVSTVTFEPLSRGMWQVTCITI